MTDYPYDPRGYNKLPNSENQTAPPANTANLLTIKTEPETEKEGFAPDVSRLAVLAALDPENVEFEERAAFLEYSGGYDRAEAEKMAARELGLERPDLSAPVRGGAPDE